MANSKSISIGENMHNLYNTLMTHNIASLFISKWFDSLKMHENRSNSLKQTRNNSLSKIASESIFYLGLFCEWIGILNRLEDLYRIDCNELRK